MAGNAKQGGDLFDMASQPDKVQIPGDAGKMNTIKSVPRPDQMSSESDSNFLGASNLDQAADNAGDIPRSTGDRNANAQDVLTGTGDSLPATVDSKRLHPVAGGMADDPLSKGHPRYEKHSVQKGGDQEHGAGSAPIVEKNVPGLENLTDAQATDKVESKIE